jgi:hypothetical protein
VLAAPDPLAHSVTRAMLLSGRIGEVAAADWWSRVGDVGADPAAGSRAGDGGADSKSDARARTLAVAGSCGSDPEVDSVLPIVVFSSCWIVF